MRMTPCQCLPVWRGSPGCDFRATAALVPLGCNEPILLPRGRTSCVHGALRAAATGCGLSSIARVFRATFIRFWLEGAPAQYMLVRSANDRPQVCVSPIGVSHFVAIEDAVMGDWFQTSTPFEHAAGDLPSVPPVSMEISDGRGVQCESQLEQAAQTADGDRTSPLWRITIREFGTARILARWSVRRVSVATPMTRDWEDAVGPSTSSDATCTASGSSEHSVMVARGRGDPWHRRPSEHPLGSSEQMANRAHHRENAPLAYPSQHPPAGGSTAAESLQRSHGIEHPGASERWLGSAHFHTGEDRSAAERPGLSWGAVDEHAAAKRPDDP
jgi:hypothetical protein